MIGTANVLRAAKEGGMGDRVIDFSTSEVFGSVAYWVSEDAHAVAGSAGGALGVRSQKARWRTPCPRLLPRIRAPDGSFAAIQPLWSRPNRRRCPPDLIRRALRNEPITIYGDGTQIRTWCYVDDMVDALMLALETPGANGESFNVGNARAVTTIFGLAETVCRVLGAKSEIQFRDALSSDVELHIPEGRESARVQGAGRYRGRHLADCGVVPDKHALEGSDCRDRRAGLPVGQPANAQAIEPARLVIPEPRSSVH